MSNIIRQPYLTERSNTMASSGVYCFLVAKSATKGEIAKALNNLYHSKPIAVRIVNMTGKKVRRGQKVGWKPGTRKAYVQFPKGTKIEFV